MTGLIVDNFCGGGGASGITNALGRHPDIAVNHDAHSIQMHQANHPETYHYLNDVWGVDPMTATSGDRVMLAWFSPDCRHFSKAKGGTPVKKEIRDLAWVAVKWLRATMPEVVIIENVEEFQTWGPLIPVLDDNGEPLLDAKTGEPLMKPDPTKKGETFEKWVKAFTQEGYSIDWKELSACDFGAPTTRKRLFIIARRDGKPIKWPEPTHARRDKCEDLGLQPWRSAASIIDWTIPCPSIFERKKPLADASARRVAHGVMRYVVDAAEPFVMRIGQTSSSPGSKVKSANDPLSTIVSKNEHCLVTPFVAPRYGERQGQAPRTHDGQEPLPTIVPTGNGSRLVAAFLAKHYGGKRQQMAAPIDRPFPTITQSGTQNQLAVAHVTKFYGSSVNGNSVEEPLRTVTAGGNHFGLVAAFIAKYYSSGGQWQDINDPLATITTKGRLGLVTCKIEGEDYVVTDIGMRMLQPHELAMAQGFPEGYNLVGTKTEQIARIGNSVVPVLAEAIVRSQFPELAEKGLRV